ncbi:MAG: peptide-methionine (S)-S-oxide reductase MsrA [Bacteroidota bacterium]
MIKTATLGAGCFWCIEAVFQRIEGVIEVVSGYTGGKVKDPTYREICGGRTGHAEVAQITFDPSIVSFEEILEVFWVSHDPTTLNRQGADVGTQYRSAVFYHDQEQKEMAERSRKTLDESKVYNDPVVTEITELGPFYKAEDYHQNYFNNNVEQPYCQFVVKPKVDKVKRVFADKIKS